MSDAAKKTVISLSRSVATKVESRAQSEGVGARVRRSIGRPELRNLDPFLMLDEFRVARPAGFPDHPHRGFETVTYMLSGKITHEDFAGHRGTIGPGDLQWMTAGRGIVHAEIPEPDEEAHGLQLWVNLDREHKLCEPAYQELLGKDIPKATVDGVTATIIAGEAFGVKSPVYTRTPTAYLDFRMEPHSELQQPIPQGWNGFVYVLSGLGYFGKKGALTDGPSHHTLVLSNSAEEDGLYIQTKDEPCHFVLITGKPLGQPISQMGPFVMNSKDEIQQAVQDYQLGRNGFERAPNFASSVAREAGML